MKTTLIAGLVGLILLVSPLVSAQQTAPPTPAVAVHPKQVYKAADPATRARKMTDQLTTQLGLDAQTAQKVYDAALTRDQKIDAIQDGPDDNRVKNKNLQANAQAFKQTLQSILTPDQFARFQQQKGHVRSHKPNSGTVPQ